MCPALMARLIYMGARYGVGYIEIDELLDTLNHNQVTTCSLANLILVEASGANVRGGSNTLAQ